MLYQKPSTLCGEVEYAWSLNPDYGEIAKIAKEQGEKGLDNVKIELGDQ